MICRTISDLPTLLDAYRAAHDLKRGSFEQLTYSARVFERWYAARYAVPLALVQLDADPLNEFLGWLRAHGRCERTCNGKRRDLLTLAAFAARKGLAAAIPPEDVVRFREPRRMPDAWFADELRALIDAAVLLPDRRAPHTRELVWSGRHDRALLLVLYDTAFRIGATILLERSQLRGGTIVAKAETQKTFTDEPKALSSETLAALAELPAGERLFPWPYRIEAYYRRYKLWLRLAGLSDTRRDGPQKIRRTSASHLEAVRPGLAQYHLCHKTAGLAQRHYIDPRVAYRFRACDLLPRLKDRPAGGARECW